MEILDDLDSPVTAQVGWATWNL